MSAPQAAPEPEGDGAVEAGPEPHWASLDVAWPLSLVGGFAGTWAGLSSGQPGVAAVLATVAVAPLHVAFGRRREAGAAALVGLGWGLGIAGAVVGAVFEGAGPEVSEALLAVPHLSGTALPLAHLGLFAAALVAARWSRGIGALLVGSALVGGAAYSAALGALSAVQAGTHAALAAFTHLPPSLTAEAVALLMLGASLAGPRREGHDTGTRARPLLMGALGLEFLALAGWSLG